MIHRPPVAVLEVEGIWVHDPLGCRQNRSRGDLRAIEIATLVAELDVETVESVFAGHIQDAATAGRIDGTRLTDIG